MNEHKANMIMKVYQKAIEIFGSEEKSEKWLNTSNTALGGITPVQAMSSVSGVESVMDILGRIEYGVYS